ncbi:glutamic acid-rich protein-like isoform X2 [Chrysoperla carnea]|uniref:glutamic acid-rich protein-like isoform X2 n=1 Tax=Chrysoperla carnea TaxID=189513 RepID=UPI001D075160|nr:glutamic acid-rich protein-like isoform X2 [Chrysoperla carnea]
MADAQPRKRKDKRRKKDDSITGETDPRSPPTVIPQKSTSVDDTNIHVYHDAHTGGGWCAKIVFFILLAIIGVLIGFILLEYRGSTDLDAPVQDSKYAEIFEGWIDDTPQLHDDEDEHPIDDHDDEHDDDHDDDGHEDEGGSDEHDDDEENGSEEGEQEEADEEEQTEASNEVEDEEGADDDEGDHEPEDEPQADEPDDEEQEDSTELANDEEGEENPDDDENNSEANDDNDDGDDDRDDLSAEDIQKVLDSLEEDDALEEVDEAADNSNENEVIDNNPEEAELLRQQEEAEAENEEESSSVAVKFGVGVALLVVAHLVLVRKWNNATNAQVSSDSSVTMTPPQTTDTSEGDLSRRNTIVSEDTVKSLHEAMERARIESQEMTDEEDLEDEEEEEEEEEDEEEIEVKSYPKYGSSYQSEPEKLEVPGAKAPGAFDLSFNRPSPIRTSTPPGFFGDDEEAEEEKEEEEEEEEEVEEDDDEELLKKLEAKYGKLPSKQIEVSDNPEEEEEAEEDEEEEEEEEDEDEAFPSWRRVKSVPEKKPEPAEATPKASKTGGAKAFEDELLDEDQFFKEHASYDNVPNF